MSESADRVGGLGLRLELVGEDLEHTKVISHDKHALGTAHAFAHVTAKTDLAHRRAGSKRLHSGRGGVAESKIQPLATSPSRYLLGMEKLSSCCLLRRGRGLVRLIQGLEHLGVVNCLFPFQRTKEPLIQAQRDRSASAAGLSPHQGSE